ncbi:MAG: S1 RNA-binding domain-containing protein [Ruminococcaceae bacterium]|nr:S1 RNA-binding domain-containing protein [Oscillospiraceae bacterium]
MSEVKNLDENMSFQELLDQSFKTLHTGEKVTGIITAVMPNEIQVDLGVKHTGILPFDEITEDSSFDVAANFKVGDEITVVLTKFSDSEGIVMLSKKKADSEKSWTAVAEAYESQAILSGKVVEALERGIIVYSGASRIFVPGKLTGLSKDADLKSMVGKTVDFRIIEIDELRHRAKGSIRSVLDEEKKKVADAFWASAEVGTVYDGVIKSITDYGVFVDIGGVEGMVHISELAWKRVKHPTDVVSMGQQIKVFIKALDPEQRRISLGYRTEDTNPWNIFTSKYAIGDVANVKIVGLTAFGAFAEIVPDVDGLIHISQLADRRVNKVDEVVKVGDTVDVKIIDIDTEKKNISLSIRALIEPQEAEAPAEEAEAEVYSTDAPADAE